MGLDIAIVYAIRSGWELDKKVVLLKHYIRKIVKIVQHDVVFPVRIFLRIILRTWDAPKAPIGHDCLRFGIYATRICRTT